jgi:hypothetical protein
LDESLGHRTNVHVLLESLQRQWKSLTAKDGDVQHIGKAHNGQEVRGYTVITVPVKFQKRKIGAEVKCNSAGQLASLNFEGVPGNGRSGLH